MHRATVIGALALAAGVAQGGFVEMIHVGNGSGSNVKASFFGDERNVFAGQLIHDISGFTGALADLNGEQVTYCPDLAETVAKDPGVFFEIVDVEVLPRAGVSAAMGTDKANAIRRVFGSPADALERDVAANAFATAFQLVIWEIVYDFDGTAASLDVGAGNVTFTKTNGNALSNSVLAAFDALKSQAASGGILSGVIGLANDGSQDQLIVPAPGSALLASIAGLAFARRRRG